MRYLLDTNTVIYFATDHSKLDRDVISILQDETNLLYMSAESVREIIVAYKNKGFVTKKMPLISCDTRFPFYRKQGLDVIFNTK